MIAGALYQVVQASAFAAHHEHAVACHIEAVVIGLAALIEADDPDVLLFQLLERTDKVHDTGDSQVFRCACARLHGNWTQRRGSPLGHDHAVDACSIGDAEQGSEVLRIFDAVEREEQSRLARIWRFEEIFDGQQFFGADDRDNALMRGCSCKLGEMFAIFLPYAHAKLFAMSYKACEPIVVPFGGNQNMIEAPSSCLQRFSYRMHAI